MDRMQKCILTISLAILLLAVTAVFLATAPWEPVPFTPPPPEANATQGFPAPPDEAGNYRTATVKEGFTVGLCGTPAVKDGSLQIFFSSDAGNTVLLRLTVSTEEGELLGESGLLSPGQCLSALPLSEAPPAGSILKVKVCSYERETYYSMGAPVFTVRTATPEGDDLPPALRQ